MGATTTEGTGPGAAKKQWHLPPYILSNLLLRDNNLSDVPDPALARANLGISGGGGGNPFDQSLNTTDNVQFNQVNISGYGLVNITSVNGQNQLFFILGQQAFCMGYDSNRAINAIQFLGNNLYMNDGTGVNGGSIFMDSGSLFFSDINGDYENPAYVARGTTDAGYGGGISMFCNATYEMNWQNGVLTINGTGPNGSGTIQNVTSISGPITGSPVPATATLTYDPGNLPADGELIVLTFWSGGGANQAVFYYYASPTDSMQFNFDQSSPYFFETIINAYTTGGGYGATVTFDGTSVFTLTNNTGGSDGNQENGCTLDNCSLTNFAGGNDGPRTVNINSNLVVNGTLAFAMPYTTLTEANNGINLDGTYDVYFLYVGTDGVQFGVNLPDPSGLTGRELTFINTGQEGQEFYPYIMGNINNSGSGGQYNLSNTTVKLLSDGTTWWITSQV